MEDDAIIELFFQRSEDAISALNRKYGSICFRLSKNLLDNDQDAEECINDAYLGVWNAIPPQHPSPLLAFVLRIVRNISIQRYRRNSAQMRSGMYEVCFEELEECIEAKESVEEKLAEGELTAYINDFLRTLSEINCMIFVRHFWYMDSYEMLAKTTGLKEGTIRTRVVRMKKELRDYLRKRGVCI